MLTHRQTRHHSNQQGQSSLKENIQKICTVMKSILCRMKIRNVCMEEDEGYLTKFTYIYICMAGVFVGSLFLFLFWIASRIVWLDVRCGQPKKDYDKRS